MSLGEGMGWLTPPPSAEWHATLLSSFLLLAIGSDSSFFSPKKEEGRAI
jgi:hypothetical protein